MVCVLGCQQHKTLAIEPDAVQMHEVGIASVLPASGEKVERARLLVDAQELRNHELSGGNLSLEFPAGEIIEIKMTPIVALRVPDDFVGSGQITPVRAAP